MSNEVSLAFWNQENEFWLVGSYDDESDWYIGFMEINLCCENADLIIEEHVTKKLEIQEVHGILLSSSSIGICNLETGGRTTMKRRDIDAS